LSSGEASGWTGDRYAEVSTFPATSLDGTTFIAACQKSKSSEQPEEGEAEQVANECQCQFNRFQAIGFAQADLDQYAASLGEKFDYPTGDKEKAWQAIATSASDTATGCDIIGGKSQWQPAYFNHGDQTQEKLEFNEFIAACPAQDFILSNRKIGSPDRALGLCGCLAREMSTQGMTQAGLDLVTRYYRDEMEEMLAPSKKALDAAGIKYNAHTLIGPIAESIVGQAKQSGSDMIYMGTRGMTALSNMVLGSVTTRVLHLAHIPVVLIH